MDVGWSSYIALCWLMWITVGVDQIVSILMVNVYNSWC